MSHRPSRTRTWLNKWFSSGLTCSYVMSSQNLALYRSPRFMGTRLSPLRFRCRSSPIGCLPLSVCPIIWWPLVFNQSQVIHCKWRGIDGVVHFGLMKDNDILTSRSTGTTPMDSKKSSRRMCDRNFSSRKGTFVAEHQYLQTRRARRRSSAVIVDKMSDKSSEVSKTPASPG